MSAHDQHSEIAPNAPALLDLLDSAEPTPDPDFGNRARRPPEPDSPPRGASRNLGGTCPECGAVMESRLRAQYGSREVARLKLVGFCSEFDCGFMAEGPTDLIELEERDV